MSLTDGNMSAADLAAVLDNNDGNFGGNGAWWIILFLFAMWGGFGGNGWGNNGGVNDVYPYLLNNTTNGLVQSGFDTAALAGQLSGIQSAISANQVADLNRSFDTQTAIMAGLNGIQSSISQCLKKYAVGTCAA